MPATPPHARAHGTRAHTLAHGRSPARRALTNARANAGARSGAGGAPPFGSVLRSRGGGRGRRRGSLLRLRSCRSHRSVGTGTSEARRGAAASGSSRREAGEQRLDPLQHRGQRQPLARPRAPGTAAARRSLGGPLSSRGRPGPKAPGDVAPRARGVGRAQDGRGALLGMRRGPRARAARSP